MRTPPRHAFTLLELLVVLAMLGLLCLLLRPALAGGRPDVEVLQCMNNFRQLTMGWQAYVADNNERLIPGARPVAGMLDWTAAPDNTNTLILVDPAQSPLAAYVKFARLWKCPADQLQSPANPGPRVRSLSMNAALGGSPQIPNPPHYPLYRNYFAARSFSELNRPGPALTFVLIDEHPDSINDSVFHFIPGYPPSSAAWRDLPAGFHNGGAVISFADGHALLRKWQDPRTLLPPKMEAKWWPIPSSGGYPVPQSTDYFRINDRMPYR